MQGKGGKDYAPLSPKARFNANVEAIRLMRDNAGVLGEDYYSLIQERDQLQYELRTWKRKAAEGDVEAQSKVDALTKSDRWKRAEVVSYYEKIMKELKAGEKAIKDGVQHEEGDLKKIHDTMDLYKQSMLEELAAIGEAGDQLQMVIEKFNNSTNPAERNKLRLRIERMILSAGGKTTSRTSEVEKALAYVSGQEVESGDVTKRYLALASGEDVAGDARIRAAKARIKQVTDEYKRLKAEDGEKAEVYREAHARWFEADNVIKSQQRGMSSNKKLLGKGYDRQIMRLIGAQRERMLETIEGLE